MAQVRVCGCAAPCLRDSTAGVEEDVPHSVSRILFPYEESLELVTWEDSYSVEYAVLAAHCFMGSLAGHS